MSETSLGLPAIGAADVPSQERFTRAVRSKPAAAHLEFEAALLQVLVEQALPRGPAMFGKGFAGSVARAQLGQELARMLASSGEIGIAALIESGAGKIKRP